MGKKRNSDHIDCQDETKSSRAKRAKVDKELVEKAAHPKAGISTKSKPRKTQKQMQMSVKELSNDSSKSEGKVTKKKASNKGETKPEKESKEIMVKNEVEENADEIKKSSKRKPKRKVAQKEIKLEEVTKEDKDQEFKSEVKRESSSVDIFPLREIDPSKMYVGAHVSISGGIFNAVTDAVEIGAKSFAMFLRSQRQWNSKPLDEAVAKKFREYCKNHDFSPHVILPHGIYLMNCGSPDDEVLKKSRDVLVDELQRCETLGLCLYNFHPGSTCGKIPVKDCLQRIADSINIAHTKTKYVVAVLENMSCQGNTIGGKFEELAGIIELVEDKARVGVCLDTCHAFAAGFDLSSEAGYEKMMTDFDEVIGLKYLKAVHLNDSKGGLGCHLDRHENIGKGKIGKGGFNRLMNDPRFCGIPLILETPCASDDTYLKEIKMLYSMQK